MLLRNKPAGLLAALLVLSALTLAQVPAPPTSQQQAPAQGPQKGPVPPPQEPSRSDDGVFIFRTEVDEVVLHATVVDDKRRFVNDLSRESFQVFENGQPQQIRSFRREDVPVSVGILVDNSGSMRDKRRAVNQAALNFVKASNPDDQVFVVNFNDEFYLDQDFTSKVPLLQTALERIESRGGTAMYDAVVASAEHMKKSSRLEKKILLVVTDGEDNASRESLERAVRRLQEEGGPTVYTIGILGEERARRARRAMQAMAEESGGIAFFPKDVEEVDTITQQVARDIRNQYVIGYRPSTPRSAGGYRSVKVEAKAPNRKKLEVRTRTGYYPNEERASR
ncbi:MAG: VWA domain-containing protein [Candidatus Korobacteraceae bacterium]